MKYLLAFIGLLSLPSYGNLWIDSSNYQNKTDVKYLSDRGVLNLPVTTFPLLWQPIIEQLSSQQSSSLSKAERAAISRLIESYGRVEDWQLEITARSQVPSLPYTSSGVNGRIETKIGKSYSNNVVSGRLEADLVNGELGGSYVALSGLNWLAYAAAKEQFWGPGHDLSLIYGDYGKPLPSIGIQRKNPQAFDLPVLEWLGPWNAKAQFSRMESARAVPDTLLWSARVNFKPWTFFEMGFTHVSQWGGQGYDSSLGGFLDMLSGREVCASGVDDCDIDDKTRLGNQLAGIDAKLNFNLNSLSFSLYSQVVGEDAPVSGIVPADKVWMYGVSTYVPIDAGVIKAYLEYADTNRSCTPGSQVQNCLYEHSTYKSGYRYRGIPVGSQYDNDSSSLVLGLAFNYGLHAIETKLKRLHLNEDDSDRGSNSQYGGHYLTPTKQELTVLEYQHKYRYSDNSSLNFSIQSFLSGELTDTDDNTFSLSYHLSL